MVIVLAAVSHCAIAESLGKEPHATDVKGKSSDQQKAARPAARQAEPPTILRDHGLDRSRSYEYSCDKPETREDADSCQSRRSANATVEQAKYAEWQFYAGLAGIGVGLLAAVFTWQAAVAARDAARSAQHSADEARKSNAQNIALFATENRPHLSIERIFIDGDVHINREDGRVGITFAAHVKNRGNSPANKAALYIGIIKVGPVRESISEEMKNIYSEKNIFAEMGDVVFKDQEKIINKHDLYPMPAAGPFFLHLIAIVDYRFAAGGTRHQTFLKFSMHYAGGKEIPTEFQTIGASQFQLATNSHSGFAN